MKFLLKIILFVITLVLWSCATLTIDDYSKKEKLLLDHLETWKNFRIDGIIELNYKSFSFRKNISLRKNEHAFRMDIYDSGILGMHPTPFITVYMDTTIVLRLPFQTEESKLDSIFKKEKLPDFSKTFDLQKLINNKEKIVKSQNYQTNNYSLIFSKKMLIEKIVFNNPDFYINLEYSRNNELSDISFFYDEKNISNIQIDKISHRKIEIKRIE